MKSYRDRVTLPRSCLKSRSSKPHLVLRGCHAEKRRRRREALLAALPPGGHCLETLSLPLGRESLGLAPPLQTTGVVQPSCPTVKEKAGASPTRCCRSFAAVRAKGSTPTSFFVTQPPSYRSFRPAHSCPWKAGVEWPLPPCCPASRLGKLAELWRCHLLLIAVTSRRGKSSAARSYRCCP